MTAWVDLVWVMGGALAATGLTVTLFGKGSRDLAPALPGWLPNSTEQGAGDNGAIHLLFDGRDLLDASVAGRHALADAAPDSDWQAATRALDQRVPGAAAALEQPLPDAGLVLRHVSHDASRILRARSLHGLTRISLTEARPEDETITLPRDTHAAAHQELRFLRDVTSLQQTPAWAEDDSCNILWANEAYLALCPDGPGCWPPAALFPAPRPGEQAGDDGSAPHRHLLEGANGVRQFDVHRHRRTECTISHAIPCSNQIRAEGSLKAITQTLTKTFAQLPTGLAIFDSSERRLILFNPALSDLTALEPGWLSGRPRLSCFLDRLRDRQMIPEPRNYKQWRDAITANPGAYSADWSLPSGQTYRVTCRADDDGALAMVFQDISQEMSTIRGFRADLEAHEAVLDLCGEALAVFSRPGSLIMANPSYGALWNVPLADGIAQSSILDASRLWSGQCDPSPVWSEVRDFVASLQERWAWGGSLRHRQGFDIKLRVAPLPGGATLVGFQWAADTLLDRVAVAPNSAEAQAQRRA